MLLESIFGFSVILYFVWKFFVSTKWGNINTLKCEELQHDIKESAIIGNEKELKEHYIDTSQYITQKPLETSCEALGQIDRLPLKNQVSIEKEITSSVFLENVEINPSVRRQSEEKNVFENITRRESPPKEKLAEFLEKTILSGDKIQSIIQNLSLDKADIFEHQKLPDFLNSEVKRIDIIKTIQPDETLINDNIPNELHENTATKEKNILKDCFKQENQFLSDIEAENSVKPLLKRVQKQSGIPTAVNFGSLIGELKSKTKNASNGGLKPVFKKFDTESDTVDNAQVKFLCNLLETRVIGYINFQTGVCIDTYNLLT